MLHGRIGSRLPGGRALGAAALACASLAMLIPGAAQAAEQPSLVLDGAANWGVKQSFRNYVTGPSAMGSYEASQGATKAADGTIDWTPASGSVGPKATTVDIGFGGLVHFTGHQGQLDVKISDIRLQMNGETGILYVDAESKSLQSGEVQTFEDVDFANVSAAGVPAPTDSTDSLLWGPLPMTLSENGVAAFAGFYDAGTALDPISFSVEKTAEPGGFETAGKQKVGSGGGKISVGSVFCEVSECEVTAPKKLKGGGISAKVTAPETVTSAKEGKIKAKISSGAAKSLAGKNAKLKGKFVVASEGVEYEQKMSVKVEGK